MTALVVHKNESAVEVSGGLNQKQIDILKNGICRGCTNEEFEIFLMACKKTQLDPFMKQIYAVKRKMKKPDGSWGESMTVQTGIDGYRLIAERTGNYVPGPEATYTYDEHKQIVSATAYIKKRTSDGEWHLVSASAYLDEYCQSFVDRSTGEKKPTGLWATMPRTMLSKCAEAQALRRAFPAEMSGVYTKEEMAQAEVVEIIEPKISADQVLELQMVLEECDEKYRLWFHKRLQTQYQIGNINLIPVSMYAKILEASKKNMEENHAKQSNMVLE